MKILYIGHERRAAERASHALRSIAPNVTLAWAQTLPSAQRWVQGNRDLAAMIVEAEVQHQGCASFVEHVRGLGLTVAVVVVGPEHLEASLDALNAGADGYAVDGQSLEADLPRIVTGALRRTRAAARDASICTALQQRLLELEAALRNADQRRASEAAAAAEQVVQRHAEFTASLAQAAQRRDALAEKLSVAMAALVEARQTRTSEAAAAAEHLTRREAELGAGLAAAVAERAVVEQKLAHANLALHQAEQRATVERAAVEHAAAQRHAEIEERLVQEVTARKALEQKLEALSAALHETDARRVLEAASAGRLRQREAELEAALAESVAARTAAEQTLAEAEAAHQRAQEHDAADLATASARQAELEDRLAREVTTRSILEQNLANAEAAQQDTDRRHASDLATVAARLADVQRQYDDAVAHAAAARVAFEAQLTDAAAALEGARQERESEAAAAAEHLTRREAELRAALEEAVAARTALGQTFTEAEATRLHAQQRAAADLAAAAEREGELVARLNRESVIRTTLEGDLAESRKKSAHARRRFLDVASSLRRRTREHKAQLEAQLNRERADSERTLAARDGEIRQIQLERETLQHLLDTTQEQLQRLHCTLTDERQGYERARVTSAAEFQRLSAEYDQLRQSLDHVRAAFHALERVAGEHAIERARLESVVVDRDAQLSAQSASHLAAEQAGKEALGHIQDRLRLTLDAHSREMATLQRELNALGQELEVTKTRGEALRREADRAPVLQRQLDESQKENRRQFERAPYGMCWCNPDGAITHVNRSLVSLLGYRTADELRKVDFAATVFEAPADLRWLIERAVSTGAPEPVETMLKKKDRSRLVVRLHVLATSKESVEIVAEDITHLRAVEERLRQAQRMEAVGRLASEVAVTCDNLLRDVSQGGQQWLAAIGSDTALRHQGELLLGEVTRAATFLRQFAVYGNKQMSALEPVSMQRVLRDLEPVLKRVAGDDIELVLPKTSAPVDVDVEVERVERVLINVASYARERMPFGGRVKIDLASTVVDRGFIAKYPNVRPGAHVLITVTEVRSTAFPDLPVTLRPESAAAAGSRVAADKPGVDLGALLGLIRDCGGHLWMTAEPPGNMTLKIHLPKRAPDDATDPGAPVARPDRGRSLTKWFRH